MKNKFKLVVVLASLAVPVASFAETPKAGPYVSALLDVSIPRKPAATAQNNAGAASTSDSITLDANIGSRVAGGYDFGYLRVEGELGYKGSKISSVSQNGTKYDTDGNMSVFTTMVNGFVDIHNSTIVTPYLGGGVGFACIHFDNVYGTNTQSGSVSKLYHSNNDTVFAYQVGAGAEIKLSKHFSLDIGYRYFGTGKASLDKDYPKATGVKYESHDVVTGVRYTF